MAAPVLTRSQSASLVALATVLMAVSYLDRQVFAILAPTITRELAISDSTYGLLGSTFSVAYLVGPPFAGLLLDRVGVRRGLALAVVVWSIVAACHAGAMGIVSLFALRLALGVAEAPSFPGGSRVVSQSVSKVAAPRAFGFLYTGSSLGAIIAPPLATHMAAWLGWRFAFVGTAIVGLLWIPIWLFVSSREPARSALDHAPEPPTRDARIARPGVMDVLRRPEMWRAVGPVVAASPVAMFALIWGSKMLVTRFGMSQKDVGNLLWIPPLFFDAGAVVFGDIASRLRARGGNVKPLFAIGGLSCAAIALVPYAPTPMGAALYVGIAMFGVGAVSVINSSDLLSAMPHELVAVAAGTSAATQSLAYIVSSAIVGRVVAGAGYDAALFGLAVWTIPGVLVWLIWPTRNAGKTA